MSGAFSSACDSNWWKLMLNNSSKAGSRDFLINIMLKVFRVSIFPRKSLVRLNDFYHNRVSSVLVIQLLILLTAALLKFSLLNLLYTYSELLALFGLFWLISAVKYSLRFAWSCLPLSVYIPNSVSRTLFPWPVLTSANRVPWIHCRFSNFPS